MQRGTVEGAKKEEGEIERETFETLRVPSLSPPLPIPGSDRRPHGVGTAEGDLLPWEVLKVNNVTSPGDPGV